MKEEFLYYIWQHQLFNKQSLQLSTGQRLEVIKPGYRNQNNGPDFKEAHLVIDGIAWYGAVEMHIKASDWHKHGHQHDPNFENVILHVVFQLDKEIHLADQTTIPTLEVKGIYKPKVYHRYMNLIENPGKVPCAQQIGQVPALTRLSMLESVLIERLKRKSLAVKAELETTQYDWQRVAFRKIAEGLGFKTNAEGMLALARLCDLPHLIRQNTLLQKEALLLGLGGFLNGSFKDDYMKELQSAYTFQKHKFDLKEELSVHQWRFAPLRPFNYPTFRIAQLASLVHRFPDLWSQFLQVRKVTDFIDSLSVTTSAYWSTHFRPDKATQVGSAKLSKNAVVNLLINVKAPLLVAYSAYSDNSEYTERALNLLSALPAESNRITKLWKGLNWRISNAFDAQGLNELYSAYCVPHGCLNCKIGNELIRTES